MTVSPRTARMVKWSAAPVALLASAAVVATASHSAFSATTDNPSSNWQAGSVKLSDDDSNTALFATGKLKPGSSGTKCITVTSAGDLASKVKLYGTSPSSDKGLDAHLKLKIEQGTKGSFADCSGFTPIATGGALFDGTVKSFADKTNYANGLGDWAPTGSGSESRTYRFTYTLDEATPNTAQGGSAAIGFTWEAQNS